MHRNADLCIKYMYFMHFILLIEEFRLHLHVILQYKNSIEIEINFDMLALFCFHFIIMKEISFGIEKCFHGNISISWHADETY